MGLDHQNGEIKLANKRVRKIAHLLSGGNLKNMHWDMGRPWNRHGRTRNTRRKMVCWLVDCQEEREG
jgi:hypothetical protein